ncbi:hypothetical protein FC51_GL002022 [Lentilactobacillus parabuchneri DSM 5707 = NBRC 107865]|uniref:Uncharacterized protein n=1 Tax=Lentilactobacillus parabuchneri DSM 5707 = NBRC 107865 TaxID=1423784 RepID=A0A0R1YV25_9LACO|nr:hypothetical protein FC51_GL002022 [Lentilactobacillus parabuchneri DSM 5707 = NBRC 107865]KRN71860.1 hypothetical protein IV42_GL001454 [Lentilactobacillus parabuchneri]
MKIFSRFIGDRIDRFIWIDRNKKPATELKACTFDSVAGLVISYDRTKRSAST